MACQVVSEDLKCVANRVGTVLLGNASDPAFHQTASEMSEKRVEGMATWKRRFLAALILLLPQTTITLAPNAAVAQNSLPSCQSEPNALWFGCRGHFTYPDGSKYVGEFWHNERHGQGTYTYSNGAKYVGEWRDGKRHGQGTLTFPDGEKYVGEWRDGKRNGQGTFTLPNGRQYVGEWRDDEANGQGTDTFPDGRKYVGEFRNHQRNGQGAFTYPNGEKYVGQFKDGHYQGQGTYTWPDGAKCIGEFTDSKQEGQGTCTYRNGDKYVGQFRNGHYHGQGTFIFADGRTRSGIWNNDKLGAFFLPSPYGPPLPGMTAGPTPQPDSPPSTSILIPLQREGGTYVVPVKINGAVDLNFVVDSGAADVNIPLEVYMTLTLTGTHKNLYNSERLNSYLPDISGTIFDSRKHHN
jgi:hypothetical protein